MTESERDRRRWREVSERAASRPSTAKAVRIRMFDRTALLGRRLASDDVLVVESRHAPLDHLDDKEKRRLRDWLERCVVPALDPVSVGPVLLEDGECFYRPEVGEDGLALIKVATKVEGPLPLRPADEALIDLDQLERARQEIEKLG